MTKKIVAEKEKFDIILRHLLKTKPVRRTAIKTRGKHGPKTPMLAKQ